MREPPFPDNEPERLAALYRLKILDTPAEQRFDRLTRLAKALFSVPISLVSLIDNDRQWFKSRQGLEACQTPRELSFCGHAILESGLLMVPNALEDERFADNPLVTGPPYIRFYAGAPLSTSEGHRLGTLCLIDTEPRTLSDGEKRSLRDLADTVQEELAKTELHDLLEVVSKNEAKLARVTERFYRAIAGTSDGLWDWDVPAGTVWYAPRFKELLGYCDDEFPNVLESFSSHLHQDDADATWAAVNAHLEDREPYDVEYRLQTRCGDYRWFHARGQAVWDDEGRPLLMSGSIMDVSERKRAEKALIEAKEQAVQANLMKSEFLNMMSHELRTPLTVVLGYLPLLTDPEAMPPPEMTASMAKDMKTAGDQLLGLINDLLDLSKIEAGKMALACEETAVADLVDGVFNNLRMKAEAKGLALRSEIGPVKVYADRVRLRQILINLVGNAINFTERGGISVAARVVESGVEIRVRDTGIGIPEEDLPTIFERFQQVDSSSTRKVGGTGLGLAITKSLVELHGATISVTSRPGQGSEFTLVFEDPAAAAPAAIEKTAAPARNASTGGERP